MDIQSLICLAMVGALFAAVGLLNWFVLFRAPTRFPAALRGVETLQVAGEPSEVARALEGLRCFAQKRRVEDAGAVTFVLSAPMTIGISTRRTRGHWVFVRVRPAGAATAVDVGIKNKWWELGSWAERVREERRQAALAEVRARLGLG